MEEKNKVKNFFKIILKLLILIVMIAIFTGGIMLALSLIFYGQTYFNSDYKNANLVMLMGTTGQLLAAILFVKFILKKKFDYIYFKKEKLAKNIALGLFFGFLQISIYVLVDLGRGVLGYQGMNLGNLNLIFLAYFIAFFIQSTSEEVLVRGLLTRALFDKFGKKIAIILPSVFFGLLHLGNEGVTVLSTLNTILVGIFFAKLLFYTDNIMVTSGAHAGWNFSMAMIYGLNVSGFSGFDSLLNFKILNYALYDKVYGPEGSIVVTFIEIISIFIIFYLEKRKGVKNG
ncbi:MAG: CPBP family intramembrane glutamic endopeptidase [Peptoniphilus grossensis]|uniref:CPBP family intramembrane glutamic endopeptidase n=1 Tax=Peptoniphilus grossensis TaxID=1465756 RepID=UPI00290FEC08|nr:CPBP family intramembrane glutamic endopeptidase [Peptoniphilus grossensis]MDU7150809.1 CPBP family intramembrane glutamic endopeptidase [Peptoniphilus grossensis]